MKFNKIFIIALIPLILSIGIIPSISFVDALQPKDSETKNTVFTQVGDQATIILEYPDKLTFSILSGELVTNTFDIEIEKLRELN